MELGQGLVEGLRLPGCSFEAPGLGVQVRWAPHPGMVPVRDNGNFTWATITG